MEWKYQLLVILGSCFVLYLDFCLSAEDGKYGCAKDECKKLNMKCDDMDKCNGRIIKNGSLICGCCHICVEKLKHGDECDLRVFSRLPRKECGNGLKCIGDPDLKTGKCNYANTKCVQDEIKYLKETDGTDGFTMGKPKPKCNNFGEYEPVQCKDGMKCYCVDINGTRIFGEAPYTKENEMNCSCSRDFETYKQYIKSPGDAHKFMRCQSDGDYAPTQCLDEKCYCVNELGTVTKRPVDKDELKNLACHGESGETQFGRNDFDTACIAEFNRKMEDIRNMTGKLVIGIEPPSCDPDGHYSAVQCQGFECFCVNKAGVRLPHPRQILRNTAEARAMTCNCMREEDLRTHTFEKNHVTDIFSQYKCRHSGNYLPVQCTSSACFCVDIEGFQIGPPVLINYRRELPCYEKENTKEFEEILNIIWD